MYRTAIRQHMIPALGKVELARLRPSDVEAMTAAMIAAGVAASTAAPARRVLVTALSDAARDGRSRLQRCATRARAADRRARTACAVGG
jgi:hypothetical protein